MSVTDLFIERRMLTFAPLRYSLFLAFCLGVKAGFVWMNHLPANSFAIFFMRVFGDMESRCTTVLEVLFARLRSLASVEK